MNPFSRSRILFVPFPQLVVQKIANCTSFSTQFSTCCFPLDDINFSLGSPVIRMAKKEQASAIQIQHGYDSQNVYPIAEPLPVPGTKQAQALLPSIIREGSTFLKYSRVTLGLAAALLLLFPVTILPGLIVVILPIEIAVLGRVYDMTIESNSEKTTLHRLPIPDHNLAWRIEETAVRPSDHKPYTT